MSVDHWMMFGTFAQQDVFAYPSPDEYKGVILNANMVAYAPAGLAAFLHEKTANSTYLIDPLTHAFQHDPSKIANKEGRPKPSIQVLAEAYGEPISSVIGRRPLLPADVEGRELLENFVRRCLAFQVEFLPSRMRDTDAAKYLSEDEVEVSPYALVAPYFYMSETTMQDWLPVNFACAESASRHLAESSRLFASIVIGRGVLADEEMRSQLARVYSGLDVDGYLLWVDNLDEQAASGHELEALVALAGALRGVENREVVNLHGGFFSVLAGSVLGGGAFSGVTHGPEFGEFRSVVPVGGGIPISRYYLPQLHSRVRYRDALRMLTEKGWLESADAFHGNVCDCDVCRNSLEGSAANFRRFGEANVRTVRRRAGLVRIDFPTKEATDRCLRHYLQRKKREYRTASEAPDALVSSISRGYHEMKPVTGLDGVAHLKLWLRVFGRDILPLDAVGE